MGRLSWFVAVALASSACHSGSRDLTVEKGTAALVAFPGPYPWFGKADHPGGDIPGISTGTYVIRSSALAPGTLLFGVESPEVPENLSAAFYALNPADLTHIRTATADEWGNARNVPRGPGDTPSIVFDPSPESHIITIRPTGKNTTAFHGRTYGRPLDATLHLVLPSPDEQLLALISRNPRPLRLWESGTNSMGGAGMTDIDIYAVASGTLVASAHFDGKFADDVSRWAGNDVFVLPTDTTLRSCVLFSALRSSSR
jgi:hypothetical protein